MPARNEGHLDGRQRRFGDIADMRLEELGWNRIFEDAFAPYRAGGFEPLRVVREDRGQYQTVGESREGPAAITGKLRNEARSRQDFPGVGDWVAARWTEDGGLAVIHAVLPRRSVFLRKAAGDTAEEQLVAANVDVVLLVSGLDSDFNPRRIERYLTLAWDSGAKPVVVLNKADLCDDIEGRLREAESVACRADIVVLSAANASGLDPVRAYCTPGKTVALLGSSGVGKSTLINALLGAELQATGSVREDDGRGRHTTTRRELIVMPGGGILIDTPGMRELQMWGDESGLDKPFEDIATLAASCKFHDCRHVNEPGCAVRAAIESGELDPARLKSYEKILRELKYIERKSDQRLQSEEKAKWKAIHKSQKQLYKTREGR